MKAPGGFFCHNPYNKGPRAETGRRTKRKVRAAVLKRLRLTVLALLLALPGLLLASFLSFPFVVADT